MENTGDPRVLEMLGLLGGQDCQSARTHVDAIPTGGAQGAGNGCRFCPGGQQKLVILKERHEQTLVVTSQAWARGHARGLRRKRERCNGGRAANFSKVNPWAAKVRASLYL